MPSSVGTREWPRDWADGSGDNATRGTLVSGLTARDMRLLDIFEGDEYDRVAATVAVLSEPKGLADLSEELVNAGERTASKEIGSVAALTYAWSAPVSRLEKPQWRWVLP